MRRESTVQPRGGRQQFEGYDAYYGGAERNSQEATPTTPRQAKIQHSQRSREEDMAYNHAHEAANAQAKYVSTTKWTIAA